MIVALYLLADALVRGAADILQFRSFAPLRFGSRRLGQNQGINQSRKGPSIRRSRESLGIAFLLATQFFCALFFLFGILTSLLGIQVAPISWAAYELIEIGVAVALVIGVVLSAMLLLRSLRARKQAEDSLRELSGAFMDLLKQRFEDWALIPAERDVALFSIKGVSMADIAALRGTSEGTVKAQCNAIYRKAGVSGRAQLLSLFIEDLLSDDVRLTERERP